MVEVNIPNDHNMYSEVDTENKPNYSIGLPSAWRVKIYKQSGEYVRFVDFNGEKLTIPASFIDTDHYFKISPLDQNGNEI